MHKGNLQERKKYQDFLSGEMDKFLVNASDSTNHSSASSINYSDNINCTFNVAKQVKPHPLHILNKTLAPDKITSSLHSRVQRIVLINISKLR